MSAQPGSGSGGGGGGGGAGSPGKPPITVQWLVQQAQELVDKCDPDHALKFLERALKTEPRNFDVVDMLGEVSLQAGDMDAARKYFEHSIKNDPHRNSSKYLYYAQMVEGQTAVTSYDRGLALLKKEMAEAAAAGDAPLQATIRQQVAAAHASVAELYMTDLCFEDDAEARCEACIKAAMAADPKAPESWQAYAGLRLVQGRLDEAKKGAANIVKAFQSRKAAVDANPDGPEAEAPPLSYQFRIATLKILIEVGDAVHAVGLAGNLMLEDDDNVEIWYLSGLALKLAGPEHFARACLHLKGALEMLDKICKTSEDRAAAEAELKPKYDAVRTVLQDIANDMPPAAAAMSAAAPAPATAAAAAARPPATPATSSSGGGGGGGAGAGGSGSRA